SNSGAQDRTTNPYSSRHRAHFNFDSRTQTGYGTLRTYVAIHIENRDLNSVTVSPARAFIQWAGFTFGHTKSYTDVPGTPGGDSFRSLFQQQAISDTGANGTNQIAYTWELGNGMTLNVGADERRTKALANLSNSVVTIGANPATAYGPYQHPTPWVNFAVNQAWGRLGVSVIANKLNATYYTSNADGLHPGCAGGATGTTFCGNPDDKWGWAVLSGIDIKAPWAGPGDHFGGFFDYGVGSAAYSGGSQITSPSLFGGGNTVAFGVITDAVYVNGGQLQLTTTWSAGAGYEHFWLPNVSTTVYGTYSQVRYNDTVINSGIFCSATQNLVLPSANCNPGFNLFMVGMVNNWFPVAGFRLAVDVLYTRVQTAADGQTVSLNKTHGARPTELSPARAQGTLSVYCL